MSGKSRQYLPFVATPVAANTEVFMDRVRGKSLMTAAFSCDRVNKKGQSDRELAPARDYHISDPAHTVIRYVFGVCIRSKAVCYSIFH